MAETEGVTIETLLRLKDEMSEKVKHTAHEAREAAKEAIEAKDAIGEVKESLATVKERLLEFAAGAGAALGVWKLGEAFIETNAHIEEMRRQFGAVLNASYEFARGDPTESLRKGFERANELVEKLDEAEGKIRIDKDVLIPMAGRLTMAVAAAKKGTDELIPLTTKLAQAAKMTGQNYDEVAMSVQALVQHGRVMRTPFLQMLGFDRSQAKALAGDSPAARLEKVMQRLTRVIPENIADMRTFDDVVESVKISVANIQETAGKGFFDVAKKSAADLDAWLQRNKDNVQAIAEGVGKKLVSGLEMATSTAGVLVKYFDELKMAATAIASVMAIRKGAEIVSGAKAWVVEMRKGMLASAEEGGTKIGSLAGVGMVLQAAAIGYAIGTALNEYLSKQDWFNEFWKTDEERASDRMLKESSAKETRQKHSLDAQLKGYLGAQVDMGHYKDVKDAAKALLKSNAMIEDAGFKVGGRGVGAGMLRESAVRLGLMSNPSVPKPDGAPGERSRTTYDFKYSRFDITQQFDKDADPDRFAVGFANDLAALSESRVQSNYAPLFAVR
jgi:hypothetical protein